MAAPASASFEWHPARLLENDGLAKPEPYAVVVLNQPLRSLWAIKRLWDNASYRVAADGGANRLYDARGTAGESFKNLDVVIGDLDSLRDDARAYFASPARDNGGDGTDAAHDAAVTEIIHDPDQFSTDYGKAVKHIHDRHPELHVVALGGLGGRVDQGVSQLHHLYLFYDEVPDRRNYLLSSESLTFLLPAGYHHVHVREEPAADGRTTDQTDADAGRNRVFDKYVGILPMAGPSVISTTGLEWDVKSWDTRFGGHMSTSNHVLPETKVVGIEANLPVVFTIALREP